METEQIKREVFSIRVCSGKRFERADRDYLTEFIMSEIKSDMDVIVDDIFEGQNCEEYILSSDVVSIRKIRESVKKFFDHHVVYQALEDLDEGSYYAVDF